MPSHDRPPSRGPHRQLPHRRRYGAAQFLEWVEARFGGRRRPGPRRKDGEDGGVPVEPNRPNTLSGGAAAELDFDDR